MKIKIYLMLVLSTILFHSCTGSIKTTAVATSTQKMDYNGSVISEKKNVVTLTHYKEIEHVKHKIIFNLLVQNRGEAPLSIGNENISVLFKENGMNEAAVKLEIQPLDDFLRDLEKDYFNEEIRLITDAFRKIPKTADDIENAEEDYEKKMKADMFAAQFISNTDRLDDALKDYDRYEDIIPYSVFKPQIITPGSSITGLIVCDTGEIDEKAVGEYNVVISIGGEEHKFIFSRSL